MSELPKDAQLKGYLRNQRKVDAQMRKVLFDAAKDAGRRTAAMNPGYANSVRTAQLELQAQQLRLWANVGTITEGGIETNANMVAGINSIWTDELLDQMGVPMPASFRQSLLAQANNTVRNYLAREHHGFSLSERVYRNGMVSSGRIDQIINRGILRGASARELARDVAGFISPTTPGGVSYAAMRLGRTELNNSFHQAAIESAQYNPFVEKVQWSLSSSHPRPDECDGLVGKYAPNEVPDKPHPQCLCYLEQVAISKTAFVRNYKAGRYDQWAASVA